MTQTNALTKPATATAFPLRLRLHYNAGNNALALELYKTMVEVLSEKYKDRI